MRTILTSIRIDQDTDVTHVRRSARLAAKSAGAAPRDQIRFATAVSEIARNALQYAGGGVAELSFDKLGQMSCLLTRIHDRGPGIRDVEAILRGRHQSHTGLGLGLNGSQKLVDSFDISTGSGGTTVELGLHLANGRSPRELAGAASSALVDMSQGNPVDELAEQNRALRDSLAEQEFLLRELHHRTKNNLAIIQSLAALQARSAKTREAREALEVLTGRIQAFANAHSYLYKAQDVSVIDLRDHLEGLVERLAAAFRADGVRIECDVQTAPIGFEVATEIGLIVNELVTNAAKHAFSSGEGGLVAVSAVTDGRSLEICVRDDGTGLPDAERRLHNSGSLGWRIVEMGVRKLKGTLDVSGDGGLRVVVRIPDAVRA